MPAPSRYAVAADVVVVAASPEALRSCSSAAAIHRSVGPSLAASSSPTKTSIDAARRELLEETGLEPPHLQQLATFGHPNRDPRGRTISVVYGARLKHAILPAAGDDAADARWFPLTALPTTLAFDHPTILAHVLPQLADEVANPPSSKS